LPTRTEREWKEEASRYGAFWKHDGNPERPHAELTSGKHSNGFFNGGVLTFAHPHVGTLMCGDLAEEVRGIRGIRHPDAIFGTEVGSIPIAHIIASVLMVPWGYVTKSGEIDARFAFEEGATILVVDDVFTTGGTTSETIRILENHGAVVLPVLPVLCNRSLDTEHFEGRRIAPLIREPMQVWTPDECPLCKRGSEAIRPKARDAWQRLSTVYS